MISNNMGFREGVSKNIITIYYVTIILGFLRFYNFNKIPTTICFCEFSLWLNEGFASYMECDCMANIAPETGVLDRFVVEEFQRVMENDALQTSHPISVTVYHPDEISEIFDGISYAKGLHLKL